MKSWQRWMQAPQTHWFRRVLFQIHLWMGIGVGLYILLISITGSAVVLRPEFSRWFVDNRVLPVESGPIDEQTLKVLISSTYSDYEVLKISPPRFPSLATYVLLEQTGAESSRYFNQYTGEDQGPTYPWQVVVVEELVKLHDDLWLGRTGRTINGIGGGLLIMMVLSGLVIWWQGRVRWKDSLQIKRQSSRSFNWQLHSFLGFWSLLLMFSWGLSALYFAFPAPFDAIVDALDSNKDDFERPDGWLLFLIKIHFGRFGGLWGRLIWIVLGLLPAIMFITGFIIWWKRSIRKR